MNAAGAVMAKLPGYQLGTGPAAVRDHIEYARPRAGSPPRSRVFSAPFSSIRLLLLANFVPIMLSWLT